MGRVISQMREQLASANSAVTNPATLTTPQPPPSAVSGSPVASSPMEAALREELAAMRSELRNQGRTLAENAAELSRMQEHMHNSSSNGNESLQQKQSLPSLASSDAKSQDSREDDKNTTQSQNRPKSDTSQGSSTSGRPKSKSSKVCSVS